MSKFVVPLTHPKPDAQRFIRVMRGQERVAKPPLVEYLVDPAVMKPVVTELLKREWVDPIPGDRAAQKAYWDNFIAFWHHMGYDFVRLEIGLGFPHKTLVGNDPTMVSGKRGWQNQHQGMIASWDDFERYPWPKLEDADFFPFEYIATNLPEGMGLIVSHGGGIFEHLSALFSLEGLAFAIYDAPDLVAAVAERIGSLMEGFYRTVLQLPNVIAILQGDDMGFRTGTLISPEHLRQYVLPYHQKFAALAHERGVPYFLHSCGNVEAIMPDLIETVRIDGKHSFEDAIMPVTEFQARYGDRIAVLGGVDMNVLASKSPEEVRQYVRRLIDICAPKGRFAIGSGNSIASYVPLENYLTMLDEALR